MDSPYLMQYDAVGDECWEILLLLFYKDAWME